MEIQQESFIRHRRESDLKIGSATEEELFKKKKSTLSDLVEEGRRRRDPLIGVELKAPLSVLAGEPIAKGEFTIGTTYIQDDGDGDIAAWMDAPVEDPTLPDILESAGKFLREVKNGETGYTVLVDYEVAPGMVVFSTVS